MLLSHNMSKYGTLHHVIVVLVSLSPLIMSMEESISLEETNKIRISLGLKPLTEDKAPADDKEQQAARNYANHREAEAKERETKYGTYQP
jgi:hypothetical protein